MENRSYICQYCKKEYVPKRRGVQKFCSPSCRVSDHRLKKANPTTKSITVQQKNKETVSGKVKVEQVSAAGVTNAVLGSAIVEVGKNIFIAEENKPATKADILKLAASLKRYHKIKNLPPNLQGQVPYFDIEKGEVVYFHDVFPL